MVPEEDFKIVDKRHSAEGAPKENANAEKANAEKTKEAPAKTSPTEGEGFTMKEGEAPSEPHQIDFSTFVFSLATGALINMGLAPDPATNKKSKNLELARQNIELLAVLQQKTKGNLTPDETQLMESLLTEIRLRFVDASKK